MTKQGSILTFDEAKKAVVQSRRSVASSSSKGKRSANASVDGVKAPRSKATSHSSAKKTNSKIASKSSELSRKRSEASQLGKTARAPRQSGKSSKTSTRNTQSNRVSRVSQSSGKLPRVSQSGKMSKVSKFSEIRKNVTKSKVEKQFTRQFANAPSEASQAGPRAAVYRGEMGRQHKKSSKMQSSSASVFAGFLSKFSFVGFDFKRSPKLVGTTMVVICLALSCVFLYPTAQQFYITQREYDQVQAEYDAIQSRNNDIQTQVDLLSSDAGIEDRAREEYGWVKEGENAVTVHGLESDSREETTYKKSIPAGSVEAPSSWYTPILDAVFGVE